MKPHDRTPLRRTHSTLVGRRHGSAPARLHDRASATLLRCSMLPSLFVTALTGCSTTYRISTSSVGVVDDVGASQVNAQASPAKISWTDGTETSGTHLFLASDVVTWRDAAWRDSPSTPTLEGRMADVERVTFYDRSRGTLEGIGFGLLAGAVIGTLVGLMHGEETQCEPPICATMTTEGMAFAGGVLGAGVGVVLGGIIGYSVGHREEYTFVRSDSEGDGGSHRGQSTAPPR